MENKNHYVPRRDFLKAAGFITGSALLSACTPRLATAIANLEPTLTPFQPSKIETPSATKRPIETVTPIPIENLFKLGSFDTASTPFTLETTAELMKLLGYTNYNNVRITHADIPLPVTTPDFGTKEQNGIFEKAVKNNVKNPYWIIGTDTSLFEPTRIVVAYFHSLQISSPGDIARLVGGWAYKNPKRVNELLGRKIVLTPQGADSLTTSIVHVDTVSADFYDNGDGKGLNWITYDNYGNRTVMVTSKFGIPESIRKDPNFNNHYLILIGCQNIKPGDLEPPWEPWDKAYPRETANRSLLVLKITTP